MASIDGFEAGDNDASTTDETISDTTVEYKYAQLTVPSYPIVNAPDGTGETIAWTTAAATPTTTSGSSFLRLGSFPVTATATATTTSGVTTYAYSLASDPYSDAPPGFADSLVLAQLVGDPSEAATAEETDDSTETNKDNVYTSDPYKGKKMRGFVDDTRIRDDAATANLYVKGSSGTDSLGTNTTGNRKAETRRLLTKGGWWDHADGNRVSTTAGDKIEIIQGNYKQIVLGRRKASDTGDIKVTDVSGGYEFSKTYEYLADQKIWATYEESSAKHATKMSSGKEVTYFTGTLKETITGEDPSGSRLRGPDESKDPAVISKTWATRMETYVGSAEKPVPHVFALSWSGTREEVTMSAEILVTRFAAGNFTQVSTSALTIFDVKAAPIVMSINTGGLIVKADLAPFVREFKVGTIFSYTTAKTLVTPAIMSFKGKEAAATAKKEEFEAFKTVINGKADTLTLQQTTLANTQTNLTTRVDNLTLNASYGAIMHVMY